MSALEPNGVPLTIDRIVAGLRTGEITSSELVDESVRRADRVDEPLGIYVTRFDEYARTAARAADQSTADGASLLRGVLVGVKDNIRMIEGRTTAQSLVMDPAWGRGTDAPVIAALKRSGAVITGKTTLAEFAMGSADPTKPFPVPRNPWNSRLWPGGSSSGTAIGVSTGVIQAGLGTDTGGSIRVPAAFCGVTGFKPTFGLVPTAGSVPLGFTFDTIGPIARGAADCRAVLDVIGEPTLVAASSARLHALHGHSDLLTSLQGIAVGVVREDHFVDSSDPSIEPLFEDMIEIVRELGARVIEVSLPNFRVARLATLLMGQAEGFAYHRDDLQSRWLDYFASTRERLALGAMMSGGDYVQAQRVRRATQDALATLFERVDIIITPTATIGPPAYGPQLDISVPTLVENVHTGYWSCVGLPTLAMPMGFSGSGTPASIQIAGRAFADHVVLAVAALLQEHTDWHLRLPPEAPRGTVDADDRQALTEAVPDEFDLSIVKTLLALAGLPATDTEVDRLAQHLPSHRASIAMLYSVAGARGDIPPAVSFSADVTVPHASL